MVKADKLNGMKVITDDAFTLGDIAGVEVDTASWQVTHIHVDLTRDVIKEFGFRKPLLGNVTLCLSTELIKSLGDIVTLIKPLQQIKELPECGHL